MRKLAIIGGTSLRESKKFENFSCKKIKNDYGEVEIYTDGASFFIQRHAGGTPPHSINYRAYIQALYEEGVTDIIAVSSVGSLKKEMSVPSILIPDDFISLWNVPTFFNQEIMHISPTFDVSLRELLIRHAQEISNQVYAGGVYIQTTGPRFETPAEIRLLGNYGEVVGMTLGSEITLANEKGIAIAAICTVDNYANGIAGSVDNDLVRSGARANMDDLEGILERVMQI